MMFIQEPPAGKDQKPGEYEQAFTPITLRILVEIISQNETQFPSSRDREKFALYIYSFIFGVTQVVSMGKQIGLVSSASDFFDYSRFTFVDLLKEKKG